MKKITDQVRKDSNLSPRILIRQRIVSSIVSKIPSSLLGWITRTSLIIPYYHMVSDDEVLHTKHLYLHKNIKQFKDDLDFLLKNFVPINLSDLMDFLKHDRALSDRAFLLTFDDGFREMHDIVAPILLEKGISATFFINSNFIDNKRICYQHKASILAEYSLKSLSQGGGVLSKIDELLLKNKINPTDIKKGILSINYRQRDIIDEIAQLIDIDFNDYLKRNKPYMTSEQIRRLINEGFSIGAHSIDHPLYSSLSSEDQLHQTMESVKFVKERFGLEYGVFAFPHNDNGVSKKFFNEILDSGLIDATFGTGGIIYDIVPNHFQRFSLEKPVMSAEKIIVLQYAKKLYRLLKGSDETVRT